MKILNQCLSLKQFSDYVKKKNFGSILPNFLVLHHTWKPEENEWQGFRSMLALKGYYENLGWSAGPHLFIAHDGIWLFTDMYEVGIHAGTGNATWKNKSTGKLIKGYLANQGNYQLIDYSIGIEVVGNYDKKVWSGKIYQNTFGAIKILTDRLNIRKEMIKFHRDYSTKTCPGSAIKKEWVLQELEKFKLENESDSGVDNFSLNVSHGETLKNIQIIIKTLTDKAKIFLEDGKISNANRDKLLRII